MKLSGVRKIPSDDGNHFCIPNSEITRVLELFWEGAELEIETVGHTEASKHARADSLAAVPGRASSATASSSERSRFEVEGADVLDTLSECEWLCPVCRKEVVPGQGDIGCEGLCGEWFHRACVFPNGTAEAVLADEWTCAKCLSVS